MMHFLKMPTFSHYTNDAADKRYIFIDSAYIVYIVLNYLFIYFRGGSSLFKDMCFIAQWQCNTLRCRDETIVLGTNDRFTEINRLEAFLLRFNLQSI